MPALARARDVQRHAYLIWRCPLAFATLSVAVLLGHTWKVPQTSYDEPWGQHWAVAPAWMVMCALGALAATAWLRLNAQSAAAATTCAWMLSVWGPPLRMMMCHEPNGGERPDSLVSLWQCPSPGLAQMAAVIMEEFLGSGVRLGLASALLLLPPGWQALASFANTSASLGYLLAYYVRFGVASAAALPAAATTALTWPAALEMLATLRFGHLVMRGLAGGVALPVAISVAASWLPGAWAAAPTLRRAATSGGTSASAAVSDTSGDGKCSVDDAAAAGSPKRAASSSANAPARAPLLAPHSRSPPVPAQQESHAAAVRAVGPPAPARLVAAIAAARAGRPGFAPYRSTMRWATLSVKVAGDEASSAALGDSLASAMPTLVTAAIAYAARAQSPSAGGDAVAAAPAAAAPSALAGTASTGPPVVASYVGFPGCYHASAVVAADQGQLDGEELAAAVALLLPTGAELLAVEVWDKGPHPASGADMGAWVEPVVVPAGAAEAGVCLRVPPLLLTRLAAAGRGLRVVVSAHAAVTPFQDLTVRPFGDGTWPAAAAALPLRVPTIAGGLALVTLLAAAPEAAPGAQHGADTFIAVLPVLALPGGAAATEALALWDALTAAPGTAVGAAFAAGWAPFAFDLGYAQTEGLLDASARGALVAYLEGWGMHACAALAAPPTVGTSTCTTSSNARSSSACAETEAAGSAAEAEGAAPSSRHTDRPAGACASQELCKPGRTHVVARPPPAATLSSALRGTVFGFPSPAMEAEYATWKGVALLSWDATMCSVDLVRMAAWLVMLPQIARAADAAPADAEESVRLLFCACTAFTLGTLSPMLLLLVRGRAWYAPRRDTVIAAATAIGGFAGYSVVTVAALRGIGSAGMGAVLAQMISRPAVLPPSMSILQPALRRLGARQEAVAAVGGALLTKITLEPMMGRLPALFYAKWALVGVSVAGALECGMRLQWLRRQAVGGLQRSGAKAVANEATVAATTPSATKQKTV